MIQNNIKRLRKEKGMSQEQLAVGLSVVRQTVSKWENGLSVPDADTVIRMAELFQVPVNEILGVEVSEAPEDLSEALAQANELLAQKSRAERTAALASRKRELILFFSFLALVLALIFQNQLLSVILVGVCFLAALVILYRNLSLLTSSSSPDANLNSIKATTLLNGAILIFCIGFVILNQLGVLAVSQEGEKIFAALLLTGLMIFCGIVAPKLPFNRHTGLRLPWTIRDEDTWKVAHRVLTYMAVPTALLYLAGVFTIEPFETVTFLAVMAWVGIPSLISLAYYWKKFHGKL